MATVFQLTERDQTMLLKRISMAVLLAACAVNSWAQRPVPYPTPDNPRSEVFTTRFVRLGPDTDGLLVMPVERGPNARIGMVFSHPNSDNFGERPGWYMAERGYPVMLINFRGNAATDDRYLPSISMGIEYLQQLPGIDKVVLLAHSGGTNTGAFYQNIAENGPTACQGAEKIVPCRSNGIENLAPADALVLLDPTLGAAHQATAVDPATQTDGSRDPALDMFTAANGFNPNGDSNYPAEFAAAYYAAQSRRNNQLIDQALALLESTSRGNGEFANDAPMVIRGVGSGPLGARLYQADTDLQSHTKEAYLLLRADGSEEVSIIRSVRNPVNNQPGSLNMLGRMNIATTASAFLADRAVRTTADYALTEDDIRGVQWESSMTSTIANARGVTVPTLVMAMGCHYLIVPSELVYRNLNSADKLLVGVEGAEHGFYPCRDEYGDTVSRVFDFVERWVGAEGRL